MMKHYMYISKSIHGLFLLMVFNTTYDNISVMSWRQFYWWKKSEYQEKKKPPTCFKSLTNFIT